MGATPKEAYLHIADAARILLVDDEPLNLEILCEHLDDPGFNLIAAQNGAEAWSLLDADPDGFDLVLLDRMMPVMDGMELLGKLKADGRFASLPIVMQTAAATKAQVADGLRQGAYYYLTKPFEREILRAIVSAALEQGRIRKGFQNEKFDYTTLITAEFHFRDLDQVNRLAGFLARLTPQPSRTVLGISELMINAVEHGNLGITYAEKSALNERSGWREEVERRLALPENAQRHGIVRMQRDNGVMRFTVIDQGDGFNWQNYLEMSPDRAFDSHGRGIAMSRMVSFDSVEYSGCGNTVVASIAIA